MFSCLYLRVGGWEDPAGGPGSVYTDHMSSSTISVKADIVAPCVSALPGSVGGGLHAFLLQY